MFKIKLKNYYFNHVIFKCFLIIKNKMQYNLLKIEFKNINFCKKIQFIILS